MPYDVSKGGFWKGVKHWSEVLKDDAIGFIEAAKTKDTPFFMYLAFNAPHDPGQAPKEYQDMYALENISVPKSFYHNTSIEMILLVGIKRGMEL
ncbi:sulfatase-like hydrolase/transferase [Mariniflexile sp. AS56]|uniref:sulfatase-like hydrolase/transferase n=1 Tax=Mariniflexile sp. AS56 TaxID=3063957 RepID=UPI0026ECDB4B|nr:sulfatase-like hydrolase/transferase [Mariniflexile sp. AS56]MDO7172510.1 sulfatase-like hydrolase/transferase [Mariniflexile sp. AS56]